VCVETYGCTMNQGEGFGMERKLALMGHEVVRSAEEADAVVINTCTVIQATELKIRRRLRQLDSLGKTLIVTGCMASVQAGEIAEGFPEALIIPPAHYDRFEELIEGLIGSLESAREPPAMAGTASIIPIAHGCLGSCTYCITKPARGSLSSHAPGELLLQAQEAVRSGRKEILITAQDTGCYGLDIGTDLPALLESLVQIDGDYRIRVGMMNPDSLRHIQERLMKAYAHPRVYKFLHLPVQSGSDRILKAMGRGYTVEEYEEQIAHFRKMVPGLTLSTDLIIGFPEETEEDHRLSLALLSRLKPNIVNVTRFSARPGTIAGSMDGQVVSRIAKDRSREVAALRFKIAAEKNQLRIGERVRALTSEPGKEGSVICRDDAYTPIVLRGEAPLGTFIDLLITGATPTHLFARTI